MRIGPALWLVALLVMARAGAAVAQEVGTAPLAVVVLHQDPVAEGGEIYLGDIADIRASVDWLQERLAGLRIGRAAPPGQSRELYIESIRVRMRQQGLPDGAIEIVAPGRTVRVRTAARRLQPEQIVAAVEAAVLDSRGAGASGLEVVLEQAPEVLLGAGEVALEVSRPPERWSDPLAVTVDVWQDGVLWRSVTVRVQVRGERPVLVAARDLEVGEPIAPEDVVLERRAFGPGVERWLRSLEGSWRASRPIRQGEPLESRSIEPLPDLIEGDRAPLVAEYGGVLVQTVGVALADAFYGQVVQVRNVQSGEVVEGVLADDGTVRVQAW